MRILHSLFDWFRIVGTKPDKAYHAHSLQHFPHQAPSFRYRPEKQHRSIIALSVIRVCPGRRHAWIDSNVGVIRKPVGSFWLRSVDSGS